VLCAQCAAVRMLHNLPTRSLHRTLAFVVSRAVSDALILHAP
jgi:hypothetical protein